MIHIEMIVLLAKWVKILSKKHPVMKWIIFYFHRGYFSVNFDNLNLCSLKYFFQSSGPQLPRQFSNYNQSTSSLKNFYFIYLFKIAMISNQSQLNHNVFVQNVKKIFKNQIKATHTHMFIPSSKKSYRFFFTFATKRKHTTTTSTAAACETSFPLPPNDQTMYKTVS